MQVLFAPSDGGVAKFVARVLEKDGAGPSISPSTRPRRRSRSGGRRLVLSDLDTMVNDVIDAQGRAFTWDEPVAHHGRKWEHRRRAGSCIEAVRGDAATRLSDGRKRRRP